MNTSTPAASSRSAESLGPSRARRSLEAGHGGRKIDARFGDRNSHARGRAHLAHRACRPQQRLREGTQPTFRQSPPSLSRSMSATRAPSPAAPKAETSPRCRRRSR
jgi:hypothetical protein